MDLYIYMCQYFAFLSIFLRFSVFHLFSEHIPITTSIGSERQGQIRKINKKTEGVVTKISKLKLRMYLRILIESKRLKQKLDDVISNSASLYQVIQEVFIQPNQKKKKKTKKNRDLQGKLKFTVKNSWYSYSIASPHRFFICKSYGKKFHHKKFRLPQGFMSKKEV